MNGKKSWIRRNKKSGDFSSSTVDVYKSDEKPEKIQSPEFTTSSSSYPLHIQSVRQKMKVDSSSGCVSNSNEHPGKILSPTFTASSSPYLLQVTTEIMKSCRKMDDLSYLDSIFLKKQYCKHIFQMESFCKWLWKHLVCNADNATVAKANIEKKYHHYKQLAIPWFEKEGMNHRISDDVLRQRKSYLQIVAELTIADDQDGTIVLQPLELREEQKSNRVLRHFWEYRDRFLIVYVDDKLRKTWEQRKKLQNALETGQTLSGRKFYFLYDHDDKVHMFAPLGHEENGPEEMKSCKALLNWIGNLSSVTRSKRCDRISMAFTPTSFIMSLRKDQVEVRDDVLSGCGKFCFTDGVGCYGLDIQEKLKQYHPVGGNEKICAIQVRIGSAKGMLALDPTIKGVIIRPSMIKFQCSRLELEVVDVNFSAYVDRDGQSKVGEMRMNVEVVQLLEYNGVPLHIFHEILNDHLKKLRTAFESPSMFASVLKRKKIVSKGMRFNPIDRALAGGMDMTLFPVRDWVQDLLERHVQKLKKLYIPIECGASNLFGIAIKNSGLKPNQVYIQLQLSIIITYVV